jgi:hypothetical protein
MAIVGEAAGDLGGNLAGVPKGLAAQSIDAALKAEKTTRCQVGAIAEKTLSLIRSCGNNGACAHAHEAALGSKIGDVPEDPRQWCAFEYADLMEQGLSGGPCSLFMEVPEAELRLRVETTMTKDKKEFLLTTNDGAELLYARADNAAEGFKIFPTNAGVPACAMGPAFTLTPNRERDEWVLRATTCDRCLAQGKRTCGSCELAHFKHFTEEMGPAKLRLMDVEIPGPTSDGEVDVWCSTCSDEHIDRHITDLTSRRPKWSAKQRALMMDFYGRCHLASVQNFQLELDVEDPGTHRLLFGKVGPNEFILDFAEPLCIVQAFAAVLSTVDWK